MYQCIHTDYLKAYMKLIYFVPCTTINFIFYQIKSLISRDVFSNICYYVFDGKKGLFWDQ